MTRLTIGKAFNKNADHKFIKCKDLKSSDFAKQFKDFFISSADNTKALNNFITAVNGIRKEYLSL